MTAATPSGVVTFLLTDVEGSTHRWEKDADAMRTALGGRLLRGGVSTRGYGVGVGPISAGGSWHRRRGRRRSSGLILRPDCERVLCPPPAPSPIHRNAIDSVRDLYDVA